MANSWFFKILAILSLVLVNSNVISKTSSATKLDHLIIGNIPTNKDALSDVNKTYKNLKQTVNHNVHLKSLKRRTQASVEKPAKIPSTKPVKTPATKTPAKIPAINATTPIKKATIKANTPAKKTKLQIPDNEAQCDQKILLMYIDKTEGLSAHTKTDSVKWCDGISESSCCTNDMFNKLKGYWQKDIDYKSNKDHKLMKHDANMNRILRHRFRQVVDYAKKVRKKKTDATKVQSLALAKLSHSMFTENDYVTLQKMSKTCWTFLGKQTKGAYCLSCDVNEGRVRFEDPKKWKISIQDIHEYSKFCGSYIQIVHSFLDYVKD